MKLTKKQKSILAMFRPETYAICINPKEANPLVDAGLLKWMPPVWGDSNNYAITDIGKIKQAKIGAMR